MKLSVKLPDDFVIEFACTHLTADKYCKQYEGPCRLVFRDEKRAGQTWDGFHNDWRTAPPSGQEIGKPLSPCREIERLLSTFTKTLHTTILNNPECATIKAE